MASYILFYVFLFAIAACYAVNYEIASVDEDVPLFSEEPQDRVAVRGEPLVLNCAVDDSGTGIAANVTWFHDGQPLPVPDPRRIVSSNGSLCFEKVLQKRSGRNNSDEGMYHCLLKSIAGAVVSRNASLRIAGLAQEFGEWPSNSSAQVGDVIAFRCQIDSLPEAEITWEKDGQLLPTQPLNDAVNATGSSRFVALANGVLHIHDVQWSDAGTYRCVATNRLLKRWRRSPSGNLIVTPREESWRAPQFLSNNHHSSPSQLTVPQGQSVWLECLASGNPTPSITWTVNSTKVAGIPGLITTPSGYLFIGQADSSQAGHYGCTASANNVSISRVTQLWVAVPPLIVTAPKSQVFPTAKTVRFECQVAGYPLPTVRWFKDGRLLQGNGRIKVRSRSGGVLSELVLFNTITSDSGLYQCVARNTEGVASSVARLLVNTSEGRPDPPSNLRGTVLSSAEVELSWSPPQNIPASDIKAYTVHYMLADSTEELQEVALNTSFKFDRLRPNTNYTFYVRAYTAKSASDQSERITLWNVFKASGSAMNVTLTVVSPTSLRVAWSKLPVGEAKKLLKIQYRLHNQGDISTEAVPRGATEYDLTGLFPGKKYDIRVLAGSAEESTVEWLTKEMPRRRNATPFFHLTSVNKTSIRVTWEKVKEAKGYRIYFRQGSSRPKGPVSVNSHAERSYVITGLNANTTYEVQLLAYSDHWEGPLSSRFIKTLAVVEDADSSAARGKPDCAIEIVPLNSKSAKVLWRVPVDDASIAYFTIKYQPYLPTSTETSPVYMRTTLLEADLDDLLPYTDYLLSIRYHYNSGEFSQFSQESQFRTPADLPSPPQRVTAVANGSSLIVSWQPPLQPSGIIINYEVFYSMDVPVEAASWLSREEIGFKLRSVLLGLVSGKSYLVKLRAKNEAGYGNFTEILKVSLPLETTDGLKDHLGNESDSLADHRIGIIVGLAVGLVFLTASTVLVLWRTHCIKRAAHGRSRTASGAISVTGSNPSANRGLVQVSGNGFHKPSIQIKRKTSRAKVGNATGYEDRISSLEMETFTPMLSNIPPCNNEHLDTKGGYSTVLPVSTGRSLHCPAEEPFLQRNLDETGHYEEMHFNSSKTLETTFPLQRLALSSSSHSSLQSLGACSDEGRLSGNSVRSWSDDNDTGICSVGPYAGGSELRYAAYLSSNRAREAEELVT